MKKLILGLMAMIALAVTAVAGTTNWYGIPQEPDAYNNTTLGTIWLPNSTTTNNILLGNGAGYNIIAGTNDIEIGNLGTAGDDFQIRIGTPGTHTNTVLSGTVTTTSNLVAGGLQITGGGVPTVAMCLSNAVTIISAGLNGTYSLLMAGSCDSAVTMLVSNGSTHAWTNTYGFLLLTNTFSVPRASSNYVVTVSPWQFPGAAINCYTYCAPGEFIATNQTASSFVLQCTGAGTALPSSGILGLQYTVFGP